MAVSKNGSVSELDIKVQTGTSAAGKAQYRARKFNNVKATVTDDDLFAIGTEIGKLQADPVQAVSRVDTSDLISA